MLEECIALFDTLPIAARARVHLVSLPIEDLDENAAMVNAFQRHANVVLQEGFGLTDAEAMIKARPVVASRIGRFQDQIRDEQEGLLVKQPTDLGEFGHAVNRLLENRTLAASLGAAAQARSVEEFVGDRHLMQYADLVFRLATT